MSRARPRAPRAARRALALAAAALAAAACAPPASRVTPVRARGARVTLYAAPETPVCAESLADAERFLARTAAYLGVAPPEVHYHVYDRGTPVEVCPAAAEACVFAPGRVAGAERVLHGALARALTAGAGEDRLPFLREGLVGALEPHADDVAFRRDRVLERVFGRPGWDEYAAIAGAEMRNMAAGFARYFIARFGLDAFRRLHDTVPAGADLAAVRARVEAATGEPFDATLAGWRAAPDADLARAPQGLAPRECDAQAAALEVPPDGAPLAQATDVSRCAWRPTELLDGGTRVAVDVPRDGVYALEHDPSAPVRVAVRRCDGAVAWDGGAPHRARSPVLVALRAGRHALVFVPDDDPAPPAPTVAVRWSLRALAPSLAASCPDVPRYALPADGAARVTLAGSPLEWPARGEARALRVLLDAPRGGRLRARVAAVPAGWTLDVCQGGCEAMGCQSLRSLDDGASARIDAAGPLLIDWSAPAVRRAAAEVELSPR